MNETPKKMWWVIVAKLFRWIFLIIGSVATFTAGEFLVRRFTEHTRVADKVPYILVNLIAIVFWLWLLSPILRRLFPPFFRLIKRFYRWFFSWQTFRRSLVALAVLATLIAIFYTEEDWRGKWAWENCKRQLEAQGVVLDWDKFLPPSVPDDQNFYTASTNILLRFKMIPDEDGVYYERKKSLQLQWLNLNPFGSNGVPLFPVFNTSSNPPPIVAEMIVSPEATQIFVSPAVKPPQNTNILAVTFNDPAAPGQVRDLLRATVGQSIDGAEGFKFSERQLADIRPAQIFVRAQTPPSEDDLAGLIPSDTLTNIGRLQIANTSNPKIFRILLTPVRITAAADYLKWSDQYVPAFDEIREALKRPYAILPGDYSQPYQQPIPNFVVMRALAQTLAQRAQCYLLLGEPDKALHELMFIHDVCRILEKPPTGQPETLVEAMIDVAIHGLYVAVIQEGFQRHAWQEPQLAALQEQLAQINLPPLVTRAFESERAATCRDLQNEGLGVLFAAYDRVNAAYPWGKFKNLELHCLADFGPRGWDYQNMAAIATITTRQREILDVTNDTIQPEKLKDIRREMDDLARPYMFYLYIGQFLPNFTKAWQTTAYDQTMVNEAQIACALKRYRLAHGEYPETLDALVPQYMQAIPHDIIGGQPLHYRRTDDGKFLLYSVGWNGTDDGGEEPPHNQYGVPNDFTKGDWIWPVAEE